MMSCSERLNNKADITDITQNQQPMVEFWNTPAPTKLVKNAIEGRLEKHSILSQSSRVIFPLLYSDIAELTDVVYPPTRPKKNGETAFLLTLRILLIGVLKYLVILSIAPDSVTISETIIKGKSDGIRNDTHCLRAFDTERCAMIGFLSKRTSKNTEKIEQILVNDTILLLFSLCFL